MTLPLAAAAVVIAVSVLLAVTSLALHRRSRAARAALKDHDGSSREAQTLLRRAVTDLRGSLLLGLLAAINLVLLGAH